MNFRGKPVPFGILGALRAFLLSEVVVVPIIERLQVERLIDRVGKNKCGDMSNWIQEVLI